MNHHLRFRSRTIARARGVGLITAVFLVVVLAGLGVAIMTLFASQQAASSLDELGSRAYQAARAGVEWGVYQQLRNNQCNGPTTFAFPSSATSLSGFSVTVKCTVSDSALVPRWIITAYACNQPGANGCPNPSNSPDYVARQLEVVL